MLQPQSSFPLLSKGAHLFRMIFDVSCPEEIEIKWWFIDAEFLTNELAQFSEHFCYTGRVMIGMLRMPKVLQFSRVIDEVIQCNVAGRIKVLQGVRVSVLLGTEPPHDFVTTIHHRAEECASAEIRCTIL